MIRICRIMTRTIKNRIASVIAAALLLTGAAMSARAEPLLERLHQDLTRRRRWT